MSDNAMELELLRGIEDITLYVRGLRYTEIESGEFNLKSFVGFRIGFIICIIFWNILE